jgi:ketosteroid isomerase-like protein
MDGEISMDGEVSRMSRPILRLMVLAVAASAWGQSSWTPTDAVQPNAEAFAPLRKAWAQNLREKNVQACVAEYTPDSVFVQPDGSRVTGSEALRQLYEMITNTFDSNLVFNSKHIEISADAAADTGTYREVLTTRATGKRQLVWGGYETDYRQRKDGRWLIAKQSWTSAGQPVALDLAPHPVVALTFDDLPAAGALPAGRTRAEIAETLTDELRDNHMAGTYGFVNAIKLENNPDAQKALHIWIDAGMNIGSHTWSHPGLTSEPVFKPLPAEEYIADVARNEPALQEYAQLRDWHWFRYPFLQEGDTVDKHRAVRAWLHDHGYRIAEVSLDFEDYAWNDAYARCAARNDTAAIDWLKQSYLETATEYIELGREEQLIAFGHEIPNVMLLHATAFTTLMLPDLLQLLRSQGFSFEGLAQAEIDLAYSLDPDAGLKYGGTLPDQFMDSRHLPYPPVSPKPFQQLAHLCQ